MSPHHERTHERHATRNIYAYVASHALSKLGDALVNPKTTLTWLSGLLGAPTWLTGLLVPIREAGSMLLQVLVAGIVHRARQRRGLWILGAIVQALAAAGMAGVALWLRGWAAGLALLALVLVFALARSLSSVASKDLLGRCIAPDRRGRANGWAASLAGLATLAIGGAGALWALDDLDAAGLAILLALGALCWLLAAAMFALLDEPAADVEEDATTRAARGRLRLLLEDRVLRRFVATRGLLLCSALSAPYYVMLAQRHLGDSARLLLLLIVLGGLAGLLAGPAWGRFADRSSRRVMQVAAWMAAGMGTLVWGLARFSPDTLGWAWLLPAAYFVLSLAHEGVRVGRKTWIVNIADDGQRIDYVAASNAAIGVLLLLAGGLGAALSMVSVEAVLLGLSLCGVAGALLGASLPDAGDGHGGGRPRK